MAQEEETIDYAILVREALREVPRSVLRRVAASGLPGDHHFFITFRTDHPDTGIPARVRHQHPSEMTVVLQHQFSGLAVEEDGFGVTLRFGGRAEPIFVPFASITAFVDPSAQFGLRFEQETAEGVVSAQDSATAEETELASESVGPSGEPSTRDAESKVVEIGRFRRK